MVSGNQALGPSPPAFPGTLAISRIRSAAFSSTSVHTGHWCHRIRLTTSQHQPQFLDIIKPMMPTNDENISSSIVILQFQTFLILQAEI